ncbi:MAG: hypothetical protein ACJAS1_004707 [Oleiphilaceae bacterium]|jgi:hypothetical protein
MKHFFKLLFIALLVVCSIVISANYNKESNVENYKRKEQSFEVNELSNITQKLPLLNDNNFDFANELCISLKSEIHLSDKSIEQKIHQISQYIYNEELNGINDEVLDYSSIISGVGLLKSRWQRFQYNSEIKNENNIDVANANDMHVFFTKLKNKKPDELIKGILSGKLDKSKFYLVDGKFETLLSFLIGKMVKPNENDVMGLLDAGFVPNEFDLAFVTSEGLDSDVISKLYYASDVKADYIIKNYPYFRSFASIALEHGDFNNIVFWTSVGSKINPDKFGFDVVELINKVRHNYTEKQIIEILKMAFKEPINIDSYETLVNDFRYTGIDFSTVNFTITGDNLLHQTDIETSNIVKNKIFKLAMSDIGLQVNFNHPCYQSLAKYVTVHIFSNFSYSRESGYPNSKYSTFPVGADEDFSQKIDLAKSMNLGQTDIERVLSFDGKLEGKLAIEQYRAQKAESSSDKFNDKILGDPDLQKIKISMNEIFKLAQQGRWTEALNLLASLGASDKDSLEALIYIALSSRAPIAITLELIALGGELPENSIKVLIDNNDIKGARELIGYGLIPNYKVDHIFDPIVYTVSNGTVEMMEFLLREGVEISRSNLGLDPLDVALRTFNISEGDQGFIAALITAGVPVQPSHMQLVESIKNTDILSYNYIKENFPALVLLY